MSAGKSGPSGRYQQSDGLTNWRANEGIDRRGPAHVGRRLVPAPPPARTTAKPGRPAYRSVLALASVGPCPLLAISPSTDTSLPTTNILLPCSCISPFAAATPCRPLQAPLPRPPHLATMASLRHNAGDDEDLGELTSARYGKDLVRVCRVVRHPATKDGQPGKQEGQSSSLAFSPLPSSPADTAIALASPSVCRGSPVVEYVVQALLEGDFAESFTAADNARVVPTDTGMCWQGPPPPWSPVPELAAREPAPCSRHVLTVAPVPPSPSQEHRLHLRKDEPACSHVSAGADPSRTRPCVCIIDIEPMAVAGLSSLRCISACTSRAGTTTSARLMSRSHRSSGLGSMCETVSEDLRPWMRSPR
jgi:hypothetical protein